MSATRKVVLFYPPYDGPPLGAPLSLLCLASPLLQAGFEVKLVDNLLAPDYEQTILREASDALLLGISVLTGPHIGRTKPRTGNLSRDAAPKAALIRHPPAKSLNSRSPIRAAQR